MSTNYLKGPNYRSEAQIHDVLNVNNSSSFPNNNESDETLLVIINLL